MSESQLNGGGSWRPASRARTAIEARERLGEADDALRLDHHHVIPHVGLAGRAHPGRRVAVEAGLRDVARHRDPGGEPVHQVGQALKRYRDAREVFRFRVDQHETKDAFRIVDALPELLDGLIVRVHHAAGRLSPASWPILSTGMDASCVRCVTALARLWSSMSDVRMGMSSETPQSRS